ncbi:Mini-ribonuclease 3 [Alkaliphilus transvaalensis]|uniref:Mini-ribonuclease 3 n=1 Tax=Alkaliphilus transvaalensis TaxID=114628 RepID=UPI00068529E9|nr:ribonuclease III domain-containing protein [Alkaliphilus transvaalensis]
MESFLNNVNQATAIKTEKEARLMAPLVLAYVGDAVFEVFIRNHLVLESNVSVNELHKKATRYVKAKAQATIVHALQKELTEDEWTMVKRGRNQKSATVPKNADLSDYRYATGFETLIGYLFYTGQTERLIVIMKRAVEVMNTEINGRSVPKAKEVTRHE